MPQIYGPIIIALKVVGVPAFVAANAVPIIGNIAISAALSYAAAALTQPPGPEAGKRTLRQEQPARRYGVGRCRVSGRFMLREAQSNKLTRVIDLPEGPVDHYGLRWLNDDLVTVTGGLVDELPGTRYPDGRVQWEDRLGEDTETNYSLATTEWPTLWPSNARGDGVPSMMIFCRNGKLEDVPRDFPNGEPDPSIEAFYRAWDWRDEAQDPDDNTTWTHTRNAIVGAVNVCWRRFGMDWDECFAPNLALLTAEADVCDEAVDLDGGGTEPRYECGFFFEATNEFGDVLNILRDSMDGWFAPKADGSYVIRCGHLYEPTVAFGDAEIWDYEYNSGPSPDAVRNTLTVSFTDPTNAYSKVQTTDWADSASVARVGEKREDFYPAAVQSNGQVRRLAKRRMSKMMAGFGTFRTPLSARRGLGERYVRLNISECEDLFDTVVEIGETSIDLASQSIVWTYVIADPALDAWSPATEEGDGPVAVERPTPEALEAPTIEAVTPFFEDTGSGSGVRLRIETTGPDRDDLTWFARWRVDGGTAWVEGQFSDIDPDADVVLDTGFVTANEDLEVATAYRTGGGSLSPWSDPEPVDTSTAAVAPASPTDLSGTPGTGNAALHCRNPVSANFDSARFYVGTTNVFGASSPVGSDIPGAPGGDSDYTATLSAGLKYAWAVAKNASGTASAPVGPVSFTVL